MEVNDDATGGQLMPRVSEQYKDDQRAEIVAAARRCFVRDGFHRTTMQDVFAEAEKSAGAVYRYFPKKEDLIVAVAEHNLDDVAAVLRASLTEAAVGRGIGDIMSELLRAVLRQHHDNQLANMALVVWSESLRNTALSDKLVSAATAMTQDLAEVVRSRQRSGQWRDSRADALAQAILLILPGFLFELAVLGPEQVAAVPDAVRSLWPE